ncbi:uncharacterized protein EV422DRAFT_131671 [Fimicolochytrium jonesii]|uniref:uncharacterized protein n=1 Tax=Fimicolochytrium jonesii TaxID=1396493 RepID=UPI0022FE6580|nr:uncharacterized protein EV422DRAFT_131671 [Fimicolochytrium jonesii]KAI8825569.1 hypothetical protein EV422DRAFT_131671 [Fimicolochytrium jonesii]
MGLCSGCRKVTNLFCFNHRKNVCDRCMLTDHPSCIVRPYLAWLENSDYSPNCGICSNRLEGQQCLRLCCLHVFHVGCLKGWISAGNGDGGGGCPECMVSLE